MPSTYGYTAASVITAPAQDGFAITPSDIQNFIQQGSQPPIARAIYVGVAGDIVLVTAGGTTLTFKNCLQGSILPMATQQVKSTNTTATNLIGLV